MGPCMPNFSNLLLFRLNYDPSVITQVASYNSSLLDFRVVQTSNWQVTTVAFPSLYPSYPNFGLRLSSNGHVRFFSLTFFEFFSNVTLSFIALSRLTRVQHHQCNPSNRMPLPSDSKQPCKYDRIRKPFFPQFNSDLGEVGARNLLLFTAANTTLSCVESRGFLRPILT